MRPAAPAPCFRVKMTLEGVEPPIWRRVEVLGGTSLRALSGVLQAAMGWEGYHLYAFDVGGVEYGEFDEDGWLDFRDPAVPLSHVAGALGARMTYRYDFGDDWTHALVVEAVTEPDPEVSYPRCVDGARACPPEDCGGVGGYYTLLAALGSPRAGDAPDPLYLPDPDDLDDQEIEQLRTWAGDFDPEHFDVAEANGRLDAVDDDAVIDPRCLDRLAELIAMLVDAGAAQNLPPDLVEEAVEVLSAYAVEDPEGFLAGRKLGILAAAALHSAGMALDSPWSYRRRPNIEELASRFEVSTASVANRSRAMRDVVPSPHPFDRMLDEAMAQRAALDAVIRVPQTFSAVFEAVGFEPPRGAFDAEVLRGLAGLSAEDVDALVRALERGLGSGRLEDTTAFGSALREALRADDVPKAARDALARWVVGRLPWTLPPALEPAPGSSLLAVAYLAHAGTLRGEALADATVLSIDATVDPVSGMATEEVGWLVRALGSDASMAPDDRADLLYTLLEGTVWGTDGRLGPELVSLIAADEAIPAGVRYDTMGYLSGLFETAPQAMDVGPAVRRRALVHRLCLDEAPHTVIRGLLADAAPDPEVRGRAAAEVLEQIGAEWPRDRLETLVREGLGASHAAVRQAFFRTGLALLGDDVRRWAPEDVSRRTRTNGPETGEDDGGTGQIRLLI